MIMCVWGVKNLTRKFLERTISIKWLDTKINRPSIYQQQAHSEESRKTLNSTIPPMTIKYFEMNLKNEVNIFAIKIKSQKKEFEEKTKI